MSEPRKLKKSESLEIRLPFPTKEAFMARCRDDGRSASEALREFIDGYVVEAEAKAAAPAAPRAKMGRWIAAALAAAGVAAVAVPTLARTNHDAEFQRLDANHDGALSREEFLGRRILGR